MYSSTGQKMKKSKTLSQLHKIFWKIFSEYSRRKFADRNGYVACCSCGQIHHWKEMDAGHYISRIHLAVKYDDMNVHAQCKGCNAFKQGNPVGYRQFLVRRYNEKAVQALEDRRSFPAGFTRDGLQLRIMEYKAKLSELNAKESI
jgi:hypothetical protein